MRNRLLVHLILFALADVIVPVPLLAVMLIWVVTRRPAWFLEKVQSVYADGVGA